MQKNDLLQKEDSIIRILSCNNTEALIIDCTKPQMPKWVALSKLDEFGPCSYEDLLSATNTSLQPIESLNPKQMQIMHERFTMIANILSFVGDKAERTRWINLMAEKRNVSKQTVRKYLCLYLVYQNMTILAPSPKDSPKPLSADEKNFRYALNKYYYTRYKHSLRTAYLYMLRDKYTDVTGKLMDVYPSFRQFQYYYSKNKKLQTYYISRNGLSNYQRNNRPLLGDGIQEFAPAPGVAMLDATVCDIYLVDEVGNLVGRPILTACVDAYSSLCCGYTLSWEGGVYSLRNLMLNVIADKTELCKRHGISIKQEEWNCHMLPATLVTDMGKEYVSSTFEQISNLGVRLVNLPPYRPELKGSVEKFFDVVQGLYKPYLKGYGVIEPDYQERGTHDYRKDARLTMADFEKIILRCIVYYNSQRVIENFPYTEEMLSEGVKPYASDIWNYGLNQVGANLIPADYNTLVLTLLPRTIGKFGRKGLVANKLRYKNDGFTERYLNGGTATVAYNPDNVSCVWLVENGSYTRFNLIESRFCGMGTQEVESLKGRQKAAVKAVTAANMQAQIDLAEHIQVIVESSPNHGNGNISIKGIREHRKREQRKTRIDPMGGDTHG